MKNIEVSFNSPQCGWMSIGFNDGDNEFHTTTAHTPHSEALAEILKTLSALLDAPDEQLDRKVSWSRNPEAFDLFFSRTDGKVFFQVVEYPGVSELETDKGEIVFSTQTEVEKFCRAFYETFAQLYADRETDEFEFNWRQPFPFEEFRNLESKLQSGGQ